MWAGDGERKHSGTLCPHAPLLSQVALLGMRGEEEG